MIFLKLIRRFWWLPALLVAGISAFCFYRAVTIDAADGEPVEAPAAEEVGEHLGVEGSIYQEAPYIFPDELPLREDVMRQLFGFCAQVFGEEFLDDEDFKAQIYIQYGNRLFFQVHGRSLTSKRVEIWVLEFQYDGEAWALVGAVMNTTQELFMQHYDNFLADMEEVEGEAE